MGGGDTKRENARRRDVVTLANVQKCMLGGDKGAHRTFISAQLTPHLAVGGKENGAWLLVAVHLKAGSHT